MKKTTILFATLFLVGATSFGQTKKVESLKDLKPKLSSEKESKAAVQNDEDEKPRTDTAKVRFALYAEAGDNKILVWQNGYVVSTTTFVPTPKVTTQEELQALKVTKSGVVGVYRQATVTYTEKFKEIKQTDIFDVKAYKW